MHIRDHRSSVLELRGLQIRSHCPSLLASRSCDAQTQWLVCSPALLVTKPGYSRVHEGTVFVISLLLRQTRSRGVYRNKEFPLVYGSSRKRVCHGMEAEQQATGIAVTTERRVHIHYLNLEAERAVWKDGRVWGLKVHPQWHIPSGKATCPKPLLTISNLEPRIQYRSLRETSSCKLLQKP